MFFFISHFEKSSLIIHCGTLINKNQEIHPFIQFIITKVVSYALSI